jgi:predicted ATP-binding protein involved in virulence
MYNWKFNIGLNHVELQNFRGVEELKLEFDPKLTVLIGENGSGKTTILDALASLLQVFVDKTTSRETGKIETEYISVNDIRNGTVEATNTISINFESEKFLEEDRLWFEVIKVDTKEMYEFYLEEYEKGTYSEEAEKILKEKEDWSYTLENNEKSNYEEYLKKYPNGRYVNEAKQSIGEEIIPLQKTPTEYNFEDIVTLEWYATLNESGYEPDDISDATDFNKLSKAIRLFNISYKANLQTQDKSKHIPLSVPLVLYYPCLNATTVIKNTNERLRTDIMSAYEDALAYNSFDFTKFFRWFRWQENIKTQLGENPLLDAVANAIYQMLNDEEAVFSNLKTDWMNNPDGELLINKGKDKKPLKISQFSSGEKSILALTADLARRLATANPYAKNPLHGNGIVLIDEIDLHLHPRWQRAILPKLMAIFPNIQWVVTTHSALVISDYNIKPEQVLVLTEEEETRKKTIVSLAELQLNNSGVEPNKIYEEIMLIPLRSEEAQKKMDKLSKLLNPLDFEKPETQALIQELTERFGTEDSFIKKINHHLKLLNRIKVVA